MTQLKFGKNILFLSIMTLVTVLCWVGFEVYHAYTQPTVPEILKELIKPLDSTINITVVEDIEAKHQPSIEELSVPTTPIPTPTLELEAGEESTPSQAATQSGSLEQEE